MHECFVRLIVGLRGLWSAASASALHSKNAFHEAPLFGATSRPGIVLTRALESVPTGLGALLIIELKSEAAAPEGQRQLERYLRRRMIARINELRETSAPISAIGGLACSGAISAATAIALACVHMVASTAWSPPGGRGAFPLWVPELSISSRLPLLPRDGIKRAVSPAGFAHLCRVLAAPLRAFSCAAPVPSSVAFRHEYLGVTQHLGSGGYCDVLRVTASDGMPAALKRPRHSEAGERANLAHERAMLTALPRSPHLRQFHSVTAPPVELVRCYPLSLLPGLPSEHYRAENPNSGCCIRHGAGAGGVPANASGHSCSSHGNVTRAGKFWAGSVHSVSVVLMLLAAIAV